MHYIGFLIERGWVPYAQLGDMNMPGSYLIELAAMHLFGTGALAWRLFDFTLLAAASAAFFVVTTSPGAPSQTASPSEVGSSRRFLPALFSASLFILIHGRDGLAQGGQRDLTMAVCLLAATGFLFIAVRKNSSWAAAAFGLLSGIAVTIKPTAILLTLIQLLIALQAARASRTNIVILSNAKDPRISRRQWIASASAAYLVAPAIVALFLLREHALAAFLAALHTVVPYYASLGHRPFGYVVLHSLSPLLPLVLIWIAVVALDPKLRRPTFNWSLGWQRSTLFAGVLFGLANCIAQARALPYYRYSLLAFLLPLMALDFTSAIATGPGAPHLAPEMWAGPRRIARILAAAALILGSFFLAPQSAILIHRYRWWQTDFIATLEQNLNHLGGPQLSGHIQCIDTNSGCGNVLYFMRLEPATGVLSDFFLFGDSRAPTVRATREQFSAQILAHPPQVIVVTSRLYLADPGNYDNFAKLDRWAAFANFLSTRYTLQTQWSPARTARWWSREETPASYRIYVLRPNQ